MGIYLPNMEMPNPGHIILVEIDENGDVFAAYDGGRTKLTQHKAVPVPPHGRLIDADKLEVCDGWLREAEEYSTHITFIYSNDIDNASTIIQASGGAE